MPLVSLVTCLLLYAFMLLAAPLGAQGLNLQLETTPSIEFMRPNGGPFGMSVRVTGAGGMPVEGGWAEIRLEAPKPGLIFSTDMPLVEGARLVEMRLPIQHGKVEWQYSWPVRGEYRLAVSVNGTEGQIATKTFAIAVAESGTKWTSLSVFIAGLFICGFMAGRIFTAAPASPANSLLALFLSAPMIVSADAQLAQTPALSAPAVLTVEPPVAGKSSRIAWRFNKSAGATAPGATLSLTIKQLEENHTLFAIEKIPLIDEFALNFVFADGSEHTVTAIVQLPGQAPMRIERRVSVEPVEPPPSAALAPVTLFLAVLSLGLGVGRWSKLRTATR